MRRAQGSLIFFVIVSLASYLYYSKNKDSSKTNELAIKFENRIEHIKSAKPIEALSLGGPSSSLNSDISISSDSLESIEYDRVLIAVERFTKNSESIEASWKAYRIDLYRQIGVNQELRELDTILEQYLNLIRDLQKEISQSEPKSADYKALVELHDRIFVEMDEDVRLFVGNERFSYLKKARTNFNKAYRAHSGASIEILGW